VARSYDLEGMQVGTFGAGRIGSAVVGCTNSVVDWICSEIVFVHLTGGQRGAMPLREPAYARAPEGMRVRGSSLTTRTLPGASAR
jgi:hypothetical protein